MPALRRVSTIGCLVLLAAPLAAQQRPFTVDALLQIQRISDHQISPDGAQVAFVVQTIDYANNAKPQQIWTVPLNGGAPKQLTMAGAANTRPRWSPDSKSIAYISDRSGKPQVWLMDAAGERARQVTNLATGAGGVLFSPDGENLVFTSEVYPNCLTEACNQREFDAEENSKTKARLYDSLLFRHWNTWRGKRRTHLFTVRVADGVPRDLTPGNRDAPPFSLGGPDDYAIAPDGNELVFVMNTDEEPAVSTNSDLFVVPLGSALNEAIANSLVGGTSPGAGTTPSAAGSDPLTPRKVVQNIAADNSPVYSPDGRYVAYRAQSRAGFESDRWRLMLLDRSTGFSTPLTENLDRSVSEVTWAPDSSRLFFTAEDRGRTNIYMIPASGGSSRPIVTGASSMESPQFTPDGRTMVFAEHSGSAPVELFRATSGGAPAALTNFNASLLSGYSLPALDDFWVDGSGRERIQSFLIKPPGFQEGRRYPVLFLIHGGPQGSWGESWSYRWNAQVFAGAGYVVVMPNPRGSTGYGQRFTDEVSRDWGGRPFDDIMAVVSYVEEQPWADSDRFVAAGASYGGYMINWMLGHTNRFKALVSHAGVFDLRSETLSTEELWFPLWEFGGMPWQTPEAYERMSPSNAIENFSTPTLVSHGELDYRVPVSQALQLFTSLQMRDVPSRLLIFPDEGHWVLKPQNSSLWYNTVIEWLNEWSGN